MCRGYVPHNKLKVLNEELLLKDSSVKTLSTESSVSSIDSEDPLVKSCLKVKTQAESLKKKTSFSSEADKSVLFSTLEIKTFPLRLGDNPSISSGPPICCAWDAEFTTSFEVDEYEETRPARRETGELRVPKLLRTEWLHAEGYSRGEMMEAQATALRIQRGRMASTKESLGMVERKELVKRKFKKWVLHAPSDKELYVKWKQEQSLGESRLVTNQVISCST